MASLLAALAGPQLPWILSAAILAGAGLLWLRFRARLAPVLEALERAVALIEEAEGPAGFQQRFPTLFKKLAEDPVLGRPWQAFAMTVRPAPGREDVMGYTRRPQDHFNDSLLTSGGINLRFYNAVPHLLVGLGLFFTFAGLLAALHFASRGVAAPDVRVAQAALRDLLGAATFKFATSIAGLGSSLLFSWREKTRLHEVQTLIDRFCHALEARMIPITVEQLAAAQLDEMRRQTDGLDRLARAMFADLPEATEGMIADELAKAFAPLGRAVQRLAEHLEQQGEQLLQRAIGHPSAGSPARRSVGPGVVDTGGARDGGTAALLRELRLLRQTLERQRVPLAPPVSGARAVESEDAAGSEEGLLARDVNVQIGRLRRMLELVQSLFLALRGRRLLPAREELLASIGTLLDELRSSARAMEELRARLREERPGDEGSLALLARVEGELRRSRETLAELAESVQNGGRESSER